MVCCFLLSEIMTWFSCKVSIIIIRTFRRPEFTTDIESQIESQVRSRASIVRLALAKFFPRLNKSQYLERKPYQPISASWYSCECSVLFELEFGVFVLVGRGKLENTEKTLARTNNKFNPHMAESNQSHIRCERRALSPLALTTALSLLHEYWVRQVFWLSHAYSLDFLIQIKKLEIQEKENS